MDKSHGQNLQPRWTVFSGPFLRALKSFSDRFTGWRAQHWRQKFLKAFRNSMNCPSASPVTRLISTFGRIEFFSAIPVKMRQKSLPIE
jgi:hypothetical protein